MVVLNTRLESNPDTNFAVPYFVAGIAGAMAAGRFLQGMLDHTRGNDAVTLVAVPLFLSLVAVIACVAPSRRAMRIEAVTVLRAE